MKKVIVVIALLLAGCATSEKHLAWYDPQGRDSFYNDREECFDDSRYASHDMSFTYCMEDNGYRLVDRRKVNGVYTKPIPYE